MMLSLLRAYPWRTLVILPGLLLAGFAEGIGLSTLLPLLNIAVGDNSAGAGETHTGQNNYARLVNEFLQGIGVDPSIGSILAIIVIGSTLRNLLLLVANKQVGCTAAQIATALRLKLLRAVMSSRWEYFISQPVGRIANALATEAQRSSQAFVNGAFMITFAIQAVIYGLVAAAISWQATLLGLMVGVLTIAAANFLVRMSRRAGRKQTRLLAALTTRLTDTLQSIKPLKAMARETQADAALVMATSGLNGALQRQVFSTAVLGAVQEELLAIAIATGMFVSLVEFEMPLTTVLVLVMVLGRMLRQFAKVQREYQKVAIGASAFWSIQAAIERALEKKELFGIGKTPSLKEGIRFDAVYFQHNEHRVFDGLTLKIPAGSLTTLVGPSGAGKTTLVDLITGLLQPESGTIFIDDTRLAELDVRAWRQMIGYVPQETVLLHATVLHNVTLGDPELDDNDAKSALKDAGAWEFVRALPAGMNSTVGERGEKLSGGQRQRIMIARALAHRPRLLILDEATSALDPDGEAEIRKTIEHLRGKLTLLAISHRAALADTADRLYRLENGRAVSHACLV